MLQFKPHAKKAAALFLSAALLATSVHFTPPAAAGTEWVQPSVDKLMSWGVITGRDGGAQQLNSRISRAEFTAMVNRAYGYTEPSETPFTDVPAWAWFADDIAIGYNTGYFSGTTETTASPNNTLTREQAITLLARNMRLPESSGEVTQFADGRSFSNWAKGYIKSAVNNGIVNGYQDQTFRPRSSITRAEMIKLLADALGTLINTSGVHSLGGVAGNLTINSPGTTLRDTVIAGDLYLTGGVGLGAVTLENVTVMGRIIVAGGGESEQGASSITLRNVAAQSLLVDTLSGQYVSLDVQNDSLIPTTLVRSNAYIKDNSRDGMGLLNITLDGDDEGMSFTLSGNVKSAVNKTPGSTLIIGDGSVENLTIDESATDSTLMINNDAVVDNLNLDVGIPVRGDGDIGKLTVSASGASTTMLPDEIVIRPGITANIAGEVMDSKLGAESSEEPRILSGYPRVDDIAPYSAVGVFSTNKRGTLYYIVTPEIYGEIEDDEELVNPPTYGPNYTARGRLNIAASNTESTVRISGLTVDGTYYISAVLVDARGDRSKIKSVKFTTPDNTVPAFAAGYPSISKVIDNDAQLSAMTNKDCEMYYAVYPRGSMAPTQNNFLSNSLTGAIAAGKFNMEKNTPIAEWLTGDLVDGEPGSINGMLEEKVDYDLYLWLTDREGGLSSTVRRLPFTTKDMTPPEFVNTLNVTNEAARAITLTGAINENGTVYWVAVPSGEPYPKAPDNPNIETGAFAVTVVGGTGGGTYKEGDTVTITPEHMDGKVFYQWQAAVNDASIRIEPRRIQTEDENGDLVDTDSWEFTMPASSVTLTAYFTDPNNPDAPRVAGTTVTTGSGVALDSEYAKLQVRYGLNGFRNGAVNARENTDFTFTVTGLNAQSRYDIYYVAMDTAGNFSTPVRMLTANTLDNVAPTVKQEFTRFPEGDSVNTTRPYADTDIRLVFDEDVKSANSTASFLELYQEVVASRGDPTALREAKERLGAVLGANIQLYSAGMGGSLPVLQESDVIDYRNAVVEFNADSQLVITFKSTSDPETDALNLASGTTYFFQLRDITDTSTAQNRMGQVTLPRFTTIAAQVFIQSENITRLSNQLYPDGQRKEADIAFSLNPRSTSTVEDDIDWDMLIWLNTSADFELYRSTSPDGPWTQVENKNSPDGLYTYDVANDGSFVGWPIDPRATAEDDFPQLNATLLDDQKYYYAIHFVQLGTLSDRNSWSANITAQVNIAAGRSAELNSLRNPNGGNYESMIQAGRVNDITSPENFRAYVTFTDHSAPYFTNGYPQFEPGDTTVLMNLMANRAGTVYYLLSPVDPVPGQNGMTTSQIQTRDLDGNVVTDFLSVPESGANGEFLLSEPTYREAINFSRYANNKRIKTGTAPLNTSVQPVQVNDLEPDKDYYAYFVLQGTDATFSEHVYLYRFHTEKVIKPILDLRLNNPTVTIQTDRTATVHYMMYPINGAGWLSDPFYSYATPEWQDQNKGSTLTVLEALRNDYMSLGSVFDNFATQKAKEDLGYEIRSGGQLAGPSAGVTVAPTSPGTVKCDTTWSLSPDTGYVFLAVAKSPLGSGDAFRATYTISLVDTEAPVVDTIAPGLRIETVGGQQRISGSLVINFDEPIYQVLNPTTPQEVKYKVDSGPVIGGAATRHDDFISVERIAKVLDTQTMNIVTDRDAVNVHTRSVTVSFNRTPSPGVINFEASLSDQFGNYRRQALVVTVSIVNNEIQYSIQPAAWDGRSSTTRRN